MKEYHYDYNKLSQAQMDELAAYIAEQNQNSTEKNRTEILFRETFYTKYVKRFVDFTVSFTAFTVFLPVNLVIGAVTFFDVGNPIFFKQARIGKNGKKFYIVKFRNMNNNTDDRGILLPASERTTKWGRFVRKTSLDELLNFWSVLKGDMALIGPRPLPEQYEVRFCTRHQARHMARPGLDCPLHNPEAPLTWENRLENDVWYVQNVSMKTDLFLIYLLVKETFFGKEKHARSIGGFEGSFVGYDENGNVMDSNHIPDEYYEKTFPAELLEKIKKVCV